MISLLVPTRGRPHNIRRFAESVEATASALVEVVWCVDDDDVESFDAVIQCNECAEMTSHWLLVAPRVIPCKRWNDAWRAANGSIFGMFGDDCVFRASGWDEMVEHAFARYPDGIALVYGPDGFRNQAHASHPFLSRQWTDALGGATVEFFSQDWNDTWMNYLGDAVGRRHYIPELRIQHLHPDDPSLGVPEDDTYRQNRERCVRDRNAERYASTEMQQLREQDVARLRAVMR